MYEKKISAEVRLIKAEQMSSHNFIISRKKETPAQVFPVEFVKLLKPVVVA